MCRRLLEAIGSRSGEAVYSCHVTGAFCRITSLGINGTELDTLKARMMFTVTSLEAQASALNAQIATLTAQRDVSRQELAVALITASKLADPAAPEPEAGETEPVAALSWQGSGVPEVPQNPRAPRMT